MDRCWKIYTNDSYGGTNVTDEKCWDYTAGAPTNISLFLNDSETNVSYNQYDIANFTALINVTGLPINMTSNYTGWVQQNGTTSIVNYTTLSTSGTWWNLTVWWVGNATYAASSRTLFFNVTVVATTFTVLMPSMYAGAGYSYPITATTEPAADLTNWISFNFSVPPQTSFTSSAK